MHHEKTIDAAKGKWRGILLQFGVPEPSLTGKHGPCPLCGGKDRFRFDNKSGSGSYYCAQCGAGYGINLAMNYTGQAFKDVAPRIDALIGNVLVDSVQKPMTDASRRDILRDTWRATQPIEPGDLADKYLTARGIGEIIYPSALRFAAKLRDGEGGIRPAMVAMVGIHGQPKPASMHRTFLKSDGSAKAEMASPRKNMPGQLDAGACVMLSDYTPGGLLGIAEGIETAMSASALFDMPVWAALNTSLMGKWIPPEGCLDVVIFADNDANFSGQKAAYALANRLATQKIPIAVTVHVPKCADTDWNDEQKRGGV